MFDSVVPIGDILLRTVLAGFLGGLIGYERDVHDKPAGLRTHILVAVASATFALVGMEFTIRAAESGEPIDPLRIVQAIASGLGFIGAGTILQQKDSVKGLTTAGGLWAAGAIGLAAGVGQLVVAITTTIAVLVTLVLVGRIEVATMPDEDSSEE